LEVYSMPAATPIYKSHDGAYSADKCLPLKEAVGRGDVRLVSLRRGQYPGKRLTKNSLPGLRTVGYWAAEDDQTWALPWHRNEGIELTFVETGNIGFAVDGRTRSLEPGDLTITRPWQLHKVGTPTVPAGRLHWLVLDVGVRHPHQSWKWPSWVVLSRADLAELTDVIRHNEQPVWRGTPEIRRCVLSIAEAVEADCQGSSISRIAVGINELLIQLLNLFQGNRIPLDRSLSASRRTVQLFLDDLRSHPERLEQEWSLDAMAKSCGLATTQFVAHVRSLTNMTPMHYLKGRRLDFAAKALRQRPDRSITDIAMASGFSSSQYFATAFSGRFGCGPREYRRGSGNREARG
jgi:AraC family L-rhamnose operon regulatory protein RhaS